MLFTDIEGSTWLLRELGAAYAGVLSDQRRIMRDAIAANDGHEMGTEGDSFFVVFTTAESAVRAATETQRGLAANVWPAGATVSVRMGLHVGEPTRHEEGYVGLDINRAARIASTANGAQIVISVQLHNEVSRIAIEGVSYRDLGLHRLKDLPQPEHIFQLVVAGLDDVTTPIKSLGTQTNLPLERAHLVGRDNLVREVRQLITAGCRLVTLSGPGGMGKTSVSLAVARALADHFIDGVYFVALEQARTASAAWDATAAALGHARPDDAEAMVLDGVSGRRLLLVLDNLEQLGEEAGVVASTLLDRTECVLIATSRGPLRIRGEQDLPVPPLAVPTRPVSSDELASSPAVELFVREARRVRPSFELDDGNGPTVAAICSKLEGLPLAIELAAARMTMLSPTELDATLSRQLSLRSLDVDRPDRQRTLAAAIAWSYDLLTASDQDAFVGLSVFAGGCGLAAAAAVIAGEQEQVDVFDVISKLAGVGLVTLDDAPDGGTRISMLAVVREFALDVLATSPKADVFRQRHASYYASLAEEAEGQLRGAHQLLWRDRLSIEHGNFAGAFEWASAHGGDQALALRLAGDLGWFWYTHGRASEGRAWLERAVAGEGTVAAPAAADAAAQAKASHALGVLQQQQGDNDAAATSFGRSLALWRAEGDEIGVSQELNSLGVTRWAQGQPTAARALLEESASVARACGSDRRLATAQSNLGVLALSVGAATEAIAWLEEALIIDQRLEDAWAVAVDRTNLGAAFLRDGQLVKGHSVLSDVLAEVVTLEDPDLFASTIEGCAMAAGAAGEPERAALLVGAADAIRTAAKVPRAVLDDSHLEREFGPVRAALGRESYREAWRRGGQLSAEDVLALARAPLAAS
jgi:predicted ATPase